MHPVRTASLFLLLSAAACTPADEVDAGDGVCSEWIAFEDGRSWTYQTTTPDDSFTWTQSIELADDGFLLLTSDMPESSGVFTYRCNAGAVELVSTEADTAEGVATESYDPPWMVWPEDEPTEGLGWTSISDVTTSFEGTVSATVEQRRTGQWEITQANVEAITDEGDAWPNSVVMEHNSDLVQDGNSVVSTEELLITSLDGPGLVWSDVLTTTPTGTAASFTELVSSN